MDIEYFLKSRTAFIRYFYENSVRPFKEITIAIENEEEPYIPPYSEDDEPPFVTAPSLPENEDMEVIANVLESDEKKGKEERKVRFFHCYPINTK